jgi:hypothetical protein
MYVTDSHGNMIDPVARDAVLRFRDAFRPDKIIHGGDAFDFVSLRKGASEEEQNEGSLADVEAGVKFLKDLRPDTLMWGNHDFRLMDTMQNAAKQNAREWATMLHNRIMDELAVIGCTCHPYDIDDGQYEWADYTFLHNYNAGKHLAYQMGMQFGNCIGGHAHRFEECHPDRSDRPSAYLCGGLIDIRRAHYARRRTGTFRWQNGWMWGYEIDGMLTVNSVKQSPDGVFRIPTDFAEVA